MFTRLPFFSVTRVSGDDAHLFLHGQLSNDIKNLAENHACYATYNTPKGRVIANMIVLNRGADLFMITASDLQASLIKRLRMFVLRAKVIFEPLADYGVSVALDDGITPHIAQTPTLSFPANQQDNQWIIPLPHQGKMCVGLIQDLPDYDPHLANAWAIHEIKSGYPWISAATTETCVAQMLNQHIIGGVHFKKGCYPGQEIIARAQYRGQVKRGLAILTSPTLETAGNNIQQDKEEAGLIINSATTEEGSINLAVIKFSSINSPLADQDGNTLTLQHCFFNPEPQTN